MTPADPLPLALGAAVGSGINLYATVLALGASHHLGLVTLPPDLQIVASPLVMGAALALFLVQFLADKIPGVDHLWDFLQTFARIPGGALLAAGAMSGADLGLERDAAMATALVAGGTVAAGTHAAKAGGRLAINASPFILVAWLVSLLEDGLAITAVWLAVTHPWVLVGGLVLALLLLLWLIPKTWRALGRLLRGPMGALGETRRRYKASRVPAWVNPPQPGPEARD